MTLRKIRAIYKILVFNILVDLLLIYYNHYNKVYQIENRRLPLLLFPYDSYKGSEDLIESKLRAYKPIMFMMRFEHLVSSWSSSSIFILRYPSLVSKFEDDRLHRCDRFILRSTQSHISRIFYGLQIYVVCSNEERDILISF